MAKKIICDGCNCEIKPWNEKDPSVSDGLARMLILRTGSNYQEWDLCDPCQGKIATAIAELLPSTPRDSWWTAIRPTKTRP
jgi:hypothetical protein